MEIEEIRIIIVTEINFKHFIDSIRCENIWRWHIYENFKYYASVDIHKVHINVLMLIIQSMKTFKDLLQYIHV